MTVYVDDMKASFEPAHRAGRTYVMSHMIADTEAIKQGARSITLRQLAHMAMKRRRGQPLGTPEEADEYRRKLWSGREASWL